MRNIVYVGTFIKGSIFIDLTAKALFITVDEMPFKVTIVFIDNPSWAVRYV